MPIMPAFMPRNAFRFFYLVTLATSTSFGQIVWEKIKPLPQEKNLYSVTFGNNRFVAVGDSGTVLSSSDGVTWSKKTSGTTRTLNYVTWGNNQFIAVGDSSTILTSPDGDSWTMQPAGLTRPTALLSATFGNNRFIAVGKGSAVLTSADGSAWTADTAGVDEIFESVTFGNNQFVIVGWYGSIFTSPDGDVWTKAVSGSTSRFLSVVYAQSQFVATGLYCIYASADGVKWTMTLNPSSYLLSVTYGFGHYVTVGSGSREGRNSPVYTSQNGTTWAAESSWTPNSLNGVAFGNERFVAVGNKGTILMSIAGNSGAIPIGNFRKIRSSIHVRIGNRSVFTPPSFKNTTGPVQAQLYSVSGRMIYAATKKPAGGGLRIPVNHIAAGMYILKVIVDGEFCTFPVCIRKD